MYINEIEDLLNSTLEAKPECAEFMALVLAELGNVTNVKPYSTNPIEIFKRLKELGRIFRSRGTGAWWGGGSAGTGNGNIIVDVTDEWTNGYYFIPSLLHELTHAAPSSGTQAFSHAQMDLAAYNVIREYFELVDRSVGDYNPNTSYFSNFLNNNCRHR